MPQLRKTERTGGWYKEPERHALAAQGVRTTNKQHIVEYRGELYNLNKQKEKENLDRQMRIAEGRKTYGSVPKKESAKTTDDFISGIKKNEKLRVKTIRLRRSTGKKEFVSDFRSTNLVNRRDAFKINQEIEDYIVKDGRKDSKKAKGAYARYINKKMDAKKSSDAFEYHSTNAIEARKLYDKNPEHYKKKRIKPPKQDEIDLHIKRRRAITTGELSRWEEIRLSPLLTDL